MSLSIQRVDDFVEAHKITNQGQILAIACLIRAWECAGDNVAKFSDVAHVNATHSWINRKSPAQGSVFLPLRSKSDHKVLFEERCDDERGILKPGCLHYPIDLGLAGKLGNVEFAVADHFYIRQH